MNVLNLTYYQNFVTIVECGTISAASRKLLIAQPALSAQLKALEREFGTELLERTARKVILTSAGKILYEKAKHILFLQDDAKKEIVACTRGHSGTLRLGFPTTLPDALLSNILISFHADFPDIKLYLFEANSQEIIHLLQNGSLDAGFIQTYDEIDASLNIWATYEECLTAVYRRGNPWLSSALVSVPIKMLCDVPLSISSDVYKMLEHACSEYQFSPSTFAICTSRTATLLWAEQGAAAAIVVGTGLIPYDDHDLCFRPLSGGLLQNYHRMLVTLQNRSLSSVTQNFIHYCRINAIPGASYNDSIIDPT